MDAQLQACHAYIHILEAEIADRSAIYAHVHRANDWYEKLKHLLADRYYDLGRELMDHGVREGYLRCVSDNQFTNLITVMVDRPNKRSLICYLAMSRIREGIGLTARHCTSILNRIDTEQLIADMIYASPPGDANMYELCRIIGFPPRVKQLGCVHYADGEFGSLCAVCLNDLCERDYSLESMHKFIITNFYIPDAHFHELRTRSNVPEDIIRNWTTKNARFREHNIHLDIHEVGYVVPLV